MRGCVRVNEQWGLYVCSTGVGCHPYPLLRWDLPRRRSLGSVIGVPRIHYKGRQGDYYVMVRGWRASCWEGGVRWCCLWSLGFSSASLPTRHHQVMDRLGPSLWDLWNSQGQLMSTETVASIAVEAVAILQRLHEKGWVGLSDRARGVVVGDPQRVCVWIVRLTMEASTACRERCGMCRHPLTAPATHVPLCQVCARRCET